MAIEKKPWQRLLYEIWASVTEGHAFEVESLTVTENDTYTAPEGKAYSPVTVNVAAVIPTPKVTAQIVVSDPTAVEYIETEIVDTDFNVPLIEEVKSSETITGYCVPIISWDYNALRWYQSIIAYANGAEIEPGFAYSDLVNCTYDSDRSSVLITDPTQDVSFTATLTIE